MRTGVSTLIFAVIAVGCLISPAEARRGGSLDQILPQIREQHPGTFSDADGPFMGPDGRPHYRIKWVTPEGRIQWFDADAQTGRVTNSEGRRRDSFDDRERDRDPDSGSRSRRDRYGNDGGDDPFGNGDRHGDGNGRHQRDDWRDNSGGGPRGDWGERDRGGNRGNGNPFGGGGGGRHRGHDN